MEMQAPPLSLPSFVVLVRSGKLGGAVVAAGERDAETGCGTCRIPFLVFFFFPSDLKIPGRTYVR